jgi:hypothetical protein
MPRIFGEPTPRGFETQGLQAASSERRPFFVAMPDAGQGRGDDHLG